MFFILEDYLLKSLFLFQMYNSDSERDFDKLSIYLNESFDIVCRKKQCVTANQVFISSI